jgi:hypothetical protein
MFMALSSKTGLPNTKNSSGHQNVNFLDFIRTSRLIELRTATWSGIIRYGSKWLLEIPCPTGRSNLFVAFGDPCKRISTLRSKFESTYTTQLSAPFESAWHTIS